MSRPIQHSLLEDGSAQSREDKSVFQRDERMQDRHRHMRTKMQCREFDTQHNADDQWLWDFDPSSDVTLLRNSYAQRTQIYDIW